MFGHSPVAYISVLTVRTSADVARVTNLVCTVRIAPISLAAVAALYVLIVGPSESEQSRATTHTTLIPFQRKSSIFRSSRSQVKRLSMAAVSTKASLTEAQSKVEVLSRQLEGAQQQLDASEGLERDLQRLGREAEEMQRKADHSLEEKQVGVTPTAFLFFCRSPACVFLIYFMLIR